MNKSMTDTLLRRPNKDVVMCSGVCMGCHQIGSLQLAPATVRAPSNLNVCEYEKHYCICGDLGK